MSIKQPKYPKRTRANRRSMQAVEMQRPRRRLVLEQMESRMLLAANLFIDYGDNFPSGVLSTTQGAFRDVADAPSGPDKILGSTLGRSWWARGDRWSRTLWHNRTQLKNGLKHSLLSSGHMPDWTSM